MYCKLFISFKTILDIKSIRLMSVYNRIFSMDKAYLRRHESSKEFQLSFQYINSDLKVNRQFNFCRQLQETVSVLVSRISVNIQKEINKKSKKGKKNVVNEERTELNVNVQLSVNGDQVNGEVVCEQLFNDVSKNITLKLLDKEYDIVINSPWVSSMSLPSSILVSFPTYPTKFEAAFTDKSVSDFAWYASKDKNKWDLVGNGFMYVPTNDKINSYLKISCTPKNENTVGPVHEAISEVKVEASPGFCPFETRHQFTKEKTSDKEFRVVTYNILADLYCDSDFSRTVLYPYCPSYALNIDYRKQLILTELIGYNADIICLQEVDKKIFINDIEPVFTSLNYNCTFQLKGGLVAEGLACVFNGSRFRHLESNCIVIGEHLNKNPLFANVWDKISKNERLAERILNRTTTIQTTVLESLEHEEILFIANTHLYFHPDADHIRLLQGGLAMHFIADAVEKLKKKTHKQISLIFCGDFNSVPECGIYQLYTTGKVLEDCIDWRSNKEESVEDVSFTQPFNLASACGMPQYTNYTSNFSGCLDYIFYDTSKLSVVQVIPLPTHEEIIQNIALPSIVFPSDHLSLISDLKWL